MILPPLQKHWIETPMKQVSSGVVMTTQDQDVGCLKGPHYQGVMDRAHRTSEETQKSWKERWRSENIGEIPVTQLDTWDTKNV